jgi:hypothetical protein
MMTLDRLREHMETVPFKPFGVRMVSGKTLLVEHPEYLWIPPKSTGDFLLVEMTGKKHHLDIECVEAFEVRPSEKKAV